MPRPQGKRNPDYDEKRGEIIDKMVAATLSAPPQRASLRELAACAGISAPTLRHYFGDREGAVAAILERIGERGAPFIDFVSAPLDGFESSVRAYVALSHAGMQHGGFAHAHAVGIVEGAGHPLLGKAYLTLLLEPSLQALERRFAAHVAAGQMRTCDLRTAAFHLFSPILTVMLHQQLLGGDSLRPIDLAAFLDRTAEAFVAAYRAA